MIYKQNIIHIWGASGWGKTYIGNKIKKIFKNKIIVKDLDILRDEFIKKFYNNKKWTYINEKKYQLYIDNFINRHKNKPIIFVGLNDNIIYGKKNLYYNLYSKYNFFIQIDNITLLKQKCIRFFNNIKNDKIALYDLINDNKKFLNKCINNIKIECNLKNTIKQNNK